MTSCILTIIKNEHLYLDEWIKYHLDLGINHIFIFEDIDSESHKEITDKYVDMVSLNGIFSILDDYAKNKSLEWKATKKNNPQEIYVTRCLRYIKNTYKNQYDWCFVIDNDEYITIEKEENNLQDVLSLYENYEAFVMQWKCYGANGYINKPNYGDKGLIGTYTEEIKGVVPTKTICSYTKTCYRLNSFKSEYFLYLHQPSKLCKWCRTNFETDRTKPIYDNIYIRHYITKSWEEYVWKVNSRGFIFGNIRNYDFFFEINSDMKHMKEELINEIKKDTLVVLPYKQDGSQGNEIRIALNGWKKYCKFDYHFIVIGEYDESLKKEFPWVEFIYFPTKPKKDGQYNPHLDIQNKFNYIYNKCSKAYDGFIYMVDDNYAIKPFYLEDIMKIHYHSSSFIGDKNAPKSYWNYDKWKTRQLLDKENLPCVNYTTHYPCYFEFSKLEEIWDRYDMRNESYVFDDVYFNYFKHEEPILDSTIRLGIWNNNIFENEFQKAIDNPNIKFICNSTNGWSKNLEQALFKVIS